jgi:hypothetical protein
VRAAAGGFVPQAARLAYSKCRGVLQHSIVKLIQFVVTRIKSANVFNETKTGFCNCQPARELYVSL